MADLEQRLRSLVRGGESGTEGLFDAPVSVPNGEAVARALDWGWIYGLAFGIARAEDPFEPINKVEKRANAAARPVYTEYVGDAPAREAAA